MIPVALESFSSKRNGVVLEISVLNDATRVGSFGELSSEVSFIVIKGFYLLVVFVVVVVVVVAEPWNYQF